ncbi:MAG: protein TolR [Alphaproteobacteria bacterium]|nr:protein TolR [Alphaproteobacteria bacterium]|tara:strand:- start:35524 stop:35964 length:441 start_codon:yes stop_codon:yes gene_type:complete
MGATLATKTRSRGRRTGGSYRPMAEINVTPFVDVMLVLLIVFMVAAPLLTAGVQVDLPDAKAKQIQSEDNTPIEISLTKEGKIYIGKSELPLKELSAKLAAMTEGEFDRRIYIRGDQGLPYGQVMGLLGLINAAGYTKVALISEPQ